MARGVRIKQAEAIEALERSGGVVAVAARMLGVSRQALSAVANSKPKVKAALDGARETSLDAAEAGLMQFVAGKAPGQNSGQRLDAIKFCLRTLGRERGYGDRMEVTGKEGGPVEVTSVSFVTGTRSGVADEDA